MKSTFRHLLPEDWEQHRRLMNHAFGNGRVVTPRETPPTEKDVADSYGIFEDGKIVASLTAIPYNVYWPGAKSGQMAMGGIAGVATVAEARGQGNVEKMLSESLRVMREKGQFVSALYPFAWAFYRKQGWEWVGEKREMRIPLAELPRQHGKARRIHEAAEARPLNDAFGARYRGFIFGNEDWEGRFKPSGDKEAFAYIGADGYLIARYADDIEVKEFIAPSAEAHTALLGLLRDFGTQRKFARLTVPSDSPFWSFLMHWDIETKVWPIFMARVVDITGAMQSLETHAPNGKLILALHDPQCPWNAGIWQIEVSDGHVSVTRASATESPQIALDIQAFSQAFWGHPSLTHLRLAGRLEVKEEAAFTQLAAILTPNPVYNLIDF
jgi:predicted acetyltransferase